MPASLSDITRWLHEAKEEGARWLVVKCDTFDYRGDPSDNCCYPVSTVTPDETWKAINHNDRTMEVYDLEINIDKQLSEGRVWNAPPEPEERRDATHH